MKKILSVIVVALSINGIAFGLDVTAQTTGDAALLTPADTATAQVPADVTAAIDATQAATQEATAQADVAVGETPEEQAFNCVCTKILKPAKEEPVKEEPAIELEPKKEAAGEVPAITDLKETTTADTGSIAAPISDDGGMGVAGGDQAPVYNVGE